MSLFEQINHENRVVIAEPACGHEGQYERMVQLIECAAAVRVFEKACPAS